MKSASVPSLDISVEIAASPSRVLAAFFDLDTLRGWWKVRNAVVTPRPLGPYAIEWAPSDFRDDTLGRLGGVFHGTVMQFQAEEGFFVADAYWLPPDGDPIGPMAFEVRCAPASGGITAPTRLRVTQNGFDESLRWRRYYDVIGSGWDLALRSLKGLLER
jgi:uncharacterized protein YndB with AHSA1/START domain